MSETELEMPDDSTDLWTDPTIKMHTAAKPIRGWGSLISNIVTEARVDVTDTGLSVRAVDPANVGMLVLDWHKDGFESWTYDGPDFTVGVNLDYFEDVIGFARKPQNDPVQVNVHDGDERVQLGVRATRPDEKIQRSSRWFQTHPDSMRVAPDIPENVTEEYGWKATPDPKPFRDALIELQKLGNHAELAAEGSTMKLSMDEDLSDETFRFPDAATAQPWEPDEESGEYEFDPEEWEAAHADDRSMFSLDYMVDMAKGIRSAGMDRITLGWGQEYPITLRFANDKWGMEGLYMLAPRVTE